MKSLRCIIGLFLIALLITGCGADHGSTSLGSLPNGSVIPGAPATPSPTPTQGSGQTSGAGGGSGIPNTTAATFPTTSGSFALTQTMNLTLRSNQTFHGFASDATQLYFLLEENDGGGVKRWLFNRLPNGSSIWTSVCNVLDDGHFSGGLAWDGTYFYTLNASVGGPAYFRRFQASNCVEATALNPVFVPDWEYMPTPFEYLSYDSGSLYWYYGSPLYTTNSATGNMTGTYDGSASLGGATFYFSPPGVFTVMNGSMWAAQVAATTCGGVCFGNSDQDVLRLWKMTTSNKRISPVSWGDFSSVFESLPNGSEFVGVTAQKDTTVTLAVNVGAANPPLIRFYYFDVSTF